PAQPRERVNWQPQHPRSRHPPLPLRLLPFRPSPAPCRAVHCRQLVLLFRLEHHSCPASTTPLDRLEFPVNEVPERPLPPACAIEKLPKLFPCSCLLVRFRSSFNPSHYSQQAEGQKNTNR